MKKPFILLAVVVVASVAGGWAWNHNSHSKADRSLVFHGNVDIRQISLSFDASGRVTELRAEEGDQVRAGAVIGTLDMRALAFQAEQAEAQIAAQEQTLLRMRNGSRPEEIAKSRSALSAAQAEAASAERELALVQGIADSTQGRGISLQELDRAKTTVKVARARADQQSADLRLATLGPRAEEVAGAEAQLKAARAQLALLNHQIAQGELKVPVDAVVRSRLLEPGDMATPQRPAFALALTKPKWVRVYVGEPDLGRVKPGMDASVVTDSDPGRPIAGKVGYMSSVAEFTPKSVQTEELRTSLVYEVRVLVDDPQNLLRLGQPATVRLAAGTAR